MVASLKQLLDLMSRYGATRVYAKRLAPNDNSKNQIYLGGDFSALNIVPHGNIYTDDAAVAGALRERAKATVNFVWVDEFGRYSAPNTGLILYPRYPEVRLSGFLRGCVNAPSEVMKGRDEGRFLILGMTSKGEVLGYAVPASHAVAAELSASIWPMIGVFSEIPLSLNSAENSKTQLLSALRRIYHQQWISSQKLTIDGTKVPYAARNGGGYTLEAELGISPNSYAEPDFLGWEVKQYGVGNFESYRSRSPVTLMTPEPTGGIYRTEGVAEFMKRFGYPDQVGRLDRFNFGGRYDVQRGYHALTGLRMIIEGYDALTGKILDLEGRLMLVDSKDEIAASWTFAGMMAHWNRKHAQAAYVPSLMRSPPPEYKYGGQVLLCEQADFLLFLKAFSTGSIYYDPAIKVENASSANPSIKRRSQFRVSHAQLTRLYQRHEVVHL